MKILYLIHQFFPEYYTGTEKIMLGVMKMMQKSGHKVKVITHSSYPNSFYEKSLKDVWLKELTYQEIPILALQQKRLARDIHHNFENRLLSQVARELILQEKPDLVHIGHPMRVGELIKVLPSLGIPYIMTLTDFFTICPRYNLINSRKTLCQGPQGGNTCRKFCPTFWGNYIPKRLQLAHSILSQAKAVTCLTPFSATLIQQEFPDLVIQAIAPGIQASTLKQNERVYIQRDSLVFGYAGSLNFHKGIHVLIKAFQQVSEEFLRLKIYGSGRDRRYIKKIKKMAQADKRIEFCGVYTEEQLGDIFSSLDTLIIPSLWYETYCMSLHEAFACYVPVIASDIGVMAEAIEDKVNSFLFQMGDVNNLALVLQKIATHPEILNPIKEKLRQRPIRTLEQEGHAYFHLYNQILSESLA